MKLEISRRRFLQGTVSLSITGGAVLSSPSSLLAKNKKNTSLNITENIPTLCEMCVNKCAVIAKVVDGKVVKLDPNPLFPKSRNMLCARGVAGTKLLYDQDRLKYPLIRTGEKGSGKFKRATWEEAYAYIKDKLVTILHEEEDNRSSVAFAAGEGMAEHTFKTFYTQFGSSHFLNHTTLCLATVTSGYALTFGAGAIPDLKNAKYVILAGANRAEAIVTPDTLDLFKKTKGRGVKLIVVDPRFTATAAKSDKFLGIKTGTDLAFVLALTYVVINEKLYNKEFVETQFNNFEQYESHILNSGYTPQWAENITNIPAKDIYEVAREFMANAPKSIYYHGRRSTWSKNDFQLRRAQALFSALGGGVDTKGGFCFASTIPMDVHSVDSPIYDQAKSRVEKNEAAVVGDTGAWVPFRNMVLEDKTPYPIRALFLYKHNIMHNMPNMKKTQDFLKKLELVVTIDTMPSDTVMLSDVILPECTYLERTDPIQMFDGLEPAIAQRNKVVEPIHKETKPVIDIMRELSHVLSKPLFEITKKYDVEVQDMIEESGEEEIYAQYDLTLPFKYSQEELNEQAVSAYSGAAKILREKGVFYPNMNKYFKQLNVNEFQYYPEDKIRYSILNKKLKTPSGKVECVISNFESKGIDSMPTWKKEYEMELLDNEFRFITGRHAQQTQTSTANNKLLLDLIPTNYAWINKRVAKKMNINFGDLVEISSSIGKVTIKAYPTEKIEPKAIFFVHGFGIQSGEMILAHNNGATSSQIVEDKVEPMHGATCLHDTIVQVKKV